MCNLCSSRMRVFKNVGHLKLEQKLGGRADRTGGGGRAVKAHYTEPGLAESGSNISADPGSV